MGRVFISDVPSPRCDEGNVKRLEQFLEDNKETMPPTLFNDLVEIYSDIDDEVYELEEENESLKESQN